jgi:hypothetical protein
VNSTNYETINVYIYIFKNLILKEEEELEDRRTEEVLLDIKYLKINNC